MNINEILSFSRKIIHIFSCLCTIFSLMFKVLTDRKYMVSCTHSQGAESGREDGISYFGENNG